MTASPMNLSRIMSCLLNSTTSRSIARSMWAESRSGAWASRSHVSVKSSKSMKTIVAGIRAFLS